jgi:hypothetical protein
MTGGQFMALCTNPTPDRGAQVLAMCHMYVSGIADALKASGQVCFGPWLSQRDLFRASAWWIETRVTQQIPVAVMVSNGLRNSFPCANGVQPRPVAGPPANYRLSQAENFVRAMKVAKELLLIFGIN